MALQNFVSVSKNCGSFLLKLPSQEPQKLLFINTACIKVGPRTGYYKNIEKSFCYDSFVHCLEIPYLSKYDQISPCSLIAL